MTTVPDPCGAYTHELYDFNTTLNLLDSNVFTLSDLTLPTKSLDVATTDFTLAGTYNLLLLVYYTDHSTTIGAKQFDVVIEDYCFPSSVTE